MSSNEIGPINKHPVGCFGSMAVWLILVFTLPQPWATLTGAAVLLGYTVWLFTQKHPAVPKGALTEFPRQEGIQIEIDKALRKTAGTSDLLLRPAGSDPEVLLRPVTSTATDNPPLLRSSDPPTEDHERPQQQH